MKAPFLLLALAALPACTAATIPGPVHQLQRTALGSSHAYETARSLTDEVGPRQAGSPGDAAAVAWALRTLTAAGFTNVHAEPVKVKHWQRGSASAAIVAPRAQPLSVVALGGSVATPPNGIEADVVEVESAAGLKTLDPKKAAGTIVFINAATKRARDGSGYGEAVGGRFIGPREAQKLGALAVIIRSVGTDRDRLPHTGAKARDDQEIPAAAISVPDADLLHRLIATRQQVRIRLELTPQWLPDADSANVVGDVVGRERPQEIVLLGAHLDSWDLGTGAIDDGAGCAIAISAARLVMGLPQHPRRTVRVVLYANEENGHEGSDAYAALHAAEIPQHVAALEADAGADRAYSTRILAAPEPRARALKMAEALGPLGIQTDPTDAWGGVDIQPLKALGVPVLDVRQDSSRYFDWHHSANDTFDKIDPEQITQVSAAFATMAWLLAEMDGDLGRVPEDKRKDKH